MSIQGKYIEAVNAFGEPIRGIWKHKNDKTLVYTSMDSTSVEQQTELHDGAGPFAAVSCGETVPGVVEFGALTCGAQGVCSSGLG